MAIRMGLLRQRNWRRDLAAGLASVVRAVVEPLRLERFYPAREVERADGTSELVHTVLPQQRAIHESTAKFVLHNGGWGSAKTMGWCVELARLCLTYPGIRIVVTAAYDYYFDEFFLPTWQEVMPDESAHIRQALKRRITFANGSQIRMRAYQDPNRIRGWKAHVILIIEAAELAGGDSRKARLILKALLGRLRAGSRVIGGVRQDYPLRLFAEQNPAGHNWCWALWVKDNEWGDQGLPVRGADGQVTHYEYRKVSTSGDTYFCVRSGTHANPFLAEGYADTLEDQFRDDPLLRSRFLEGGFTPLNMLVYDYPRYSPATHVVSLAAVCEHYRTPDLPPWWPVYVGIDCAGLRSPWAAEFYMEMPGGELVGVAEIYESGLQWGDMAERILELVERRGWTDVTYWIDPRSAAQRQGENSKTIAIEFRRYGIPVRLPEGYGKSMGIRRVWDLLRRDRTKPCPYVQDRVDAETGLWEVGKAGLYYIAGAMPDNIREKGLYKFVTPMGDGGSGGSGGGDEDSEDVLPEIPEDANDHAQTAEMFMALGRRPRTEAERHVRPRTPLAPIGARRDRL